MDTLPPPDDASLTREALHARAREALAMLGPNTDEDTKCLASYYVSCVLAADKAAAQLLGYVATRQKRRA
jgi:hypothetical protein